MLVHRERYCKRTDRAEFPLWPLVALTVQLLVLELGRTFLARLLVQLAGDLLAVDTAVFHEVAGRAVHELDGVAPLLAAVGADFCCRVDWYTAYFGSGQICKEGELLLRVMLLCGGVRVRAVMC